MKLKSSWLLLLLAWAASACGEVLPLPEGELAPVALRATRQQLPSTDKVLILDSSVSGALNSREAQAVRAYSPTTQIDVLEPEEWRLLTAEQFMEYRTLIIGDAACQSGEAAFQAAIDTRRDWGAIIDGDVVIVSSNPTSNLTPRLVENAIQVALDSAQFRTGMYISLGCAYQSAPPSTVVALLEPFGHFKVEGVPGCATTGHFFRMNPPTLSGSITDGQLPGGNGCVAPSVFTSYPEHTFAFAAIATGTPEAPIPGERTYIDYMVEEGVETEFVGTPYVLVKGAMALSAGCGDQDHTPPGEECDAGDGGNGQPAPPGEDPGNTCSYACRLNWCGDGVVDEQFGEECDQGVSNGRSDDAEGRIGTCTGFCKIPDIGLPNRPPVALCKDVTAAATNTCDAPADINDGSYDPDGDLVGCVQSPPGPYLVGSTRVTLTCRDRSAQFASCTGMVTVTDLVAPTVTLEGPASDVMECTQGATYPDQGASAQDICEGPLPVTISGSVDMGSPGSYSLTYSATDASNNVGTATRAVAVNDTLPPTVTLSGPNPLQHECGAPFADPGALGTDQCAGTLMPTTSGTVDGQVPGSYSLRYSVSDPTGHSAAQDRVVTVSDTLPPSITVREPLEDILECGSPYVDPGATAMDTCAGDLTSAIVAVRSGDSQRPGSFTITYSVQDPSGNRFTSPVVRTVNVRDDLPPTLTLVEPAVQTVECATPWNEPGVTASDLCFGDLTAAITRTGTVSTDTLGDYTLMYSVVDGAGNSASSVSRTVQVRDTLAPSITIEGPLTQSAECSSAYVDPGATARDACAGDLTAALEIIGTVNTGTPGSYTLRYRVADPSGNQTTSAEVRTVTVVDEQPPTLELLGSASMRVECGSPYDDPGAKAQDACAGDLSERITRTGAVNPAMPGSYTIRYAVSDPANHRVTVLREVSVMDTQPPSIVCPEPLVVATPEDTLATISLRAATATDMCSQAQVSTPTQTEFPVGTTELTYTATDLAGNTAKCTTTVTVLAIAPPVPDLDRALIGGGNGCSSTGGGPSSLAMIGLGVLASLLARKRTRAVLPVLAVLLLGSKAVAQPTGIPPFELERLMLNPSGRGSLLLGTGELLPHGDYRLSLTSHYENDPLLLVQNGTQVGTVVRHRATMHLAAAYGLWGWVELGAQIPLVLLQRGDDLTDRGIGIPRGSLAAGTPLLSAQLKLLSQREDDLVDLALGVHAGPPVGSAAALAREFRGTPTVMVGRRFDHLQAAIDAGFMFRRSTILSPDSNVQDEIGHALRLGATLSSLGEGLRGEVALLGSVPLKREGSSVETLAGARYPVSEAFEVYGLAGLGFGTAAGTPDFRVLLGVAFERPRPPAQVEVAKDEPELPLPLDSDGDGVLEDVDRCPTVPGLEGLQGCPDQDGDGVEDGVDRCLGEAGPVDRQGCPERDSDGDGLLDGKDSCPTVAGLLDRGGCPVPDRDHDTVEDLRDNCPDVAGPPDNQGCPPEERQLVVIQKDRIEIKDTVHFDFNKAIIQPRSYRLLDQVARVLVEHPEIVAVSIEGHTDGVGTAEYNRGLSQRRAEAVRDYFAQRGVALERMQAQGFGEDRPVQSNATSAGRAANRRVEFITRYEQEQP